MRPDAAALAERLAPDARRVARSVARLTRHPWLSDELESGSLLWVCEAALDYDAARGTDPAAYVRWRVKCLALSFVRSERRRPKCSLAGRRGDDPSKDPAVRRDGPDPLAALRYAEATRNMTPAMKRVADLVCLEGLTPSAAYRSLRIPKVSGHRLWREALSLAAQGFEVEAVKP